MVKIALLVALLLVHASGTALAMPKDGCGGECAACHSLSEKEAGTILKDLGGVKSVRASTVRGLFEIQLERNGRQATAYMDYGKKNLIAGQIFDIASRQSLTPAVEKVTNVAPINVGNIPLENALVMGNLNGSKRLFVFTDPDCPYCRKLHGELKKLINVLPDVVVYIMLYPLKMHPEAYDKARLLLETKDLALLDQAFEGRKLSGPSQKQSSATVDSIVSFAKRYGITSTPTLVLADGKIVIGMQDAESLRKLISEK